MHLNADHNNLIIIALMYYVQSTFKSSIFALLIEFVTLRNVFFTPAQAFVAWNNFLFT
jgi:hypothetical protein